MDEQQFRKITDRLGELKKKLLLIQILAGVTQGFLLGAAIFRAF